MRTPTKRISASDASETARIAANELARPLDSGNRAGGQPLNACRSKVGRKTACASAAAAAR